MRYQRPRPDGIRLAALPPERPPQLLVVIDTEEEFDWRAPLTRDQHGVVFECADDRYRPDVVTFSIVNARTKFSSAEQ